MKWRGLQKFLPEASSVEGLIADWNPFGAVAAACRNLFGNPNPSALVQAWPMQHPELATLLWSGVALVVFVPLAVRMYASKQR